MAALIRAKDRPGPKIPCLVDNTFERERLCLAWWCHGAEKCTGCRHDLQCQLVAAQVRYFIPEFQSNTVREGCAQISTGECQNAIAKAQHTLGFYIWGLIAGTCYLALDRKTG